jgi:methyltransferase (TIGR00027 family)
VKPGEASRTAEVVAIQRAAHQFLDRPVVFEDPLALQVLSAEAQAILRTDPGQTERSPVSKLLRAGLAVRSRVAEDTLADAVTRGVRQYVILGAGFDTFAYRSPFQDVRVFEVDHPSTQAVKRQRLEAGSIAIPSSVTFVPFDFGGIASADAATRGGPLADALASGGFDAAQPAVAAWLGVTMYLTPEEVRDTLRFVGSFSPGSTVVFDFYLPVEAVGFVTRIFYTRVLQRLEKLGEPWRAFYTPDAIRRELQQAGFAQIETLDRDALNGRYLANRPDHLDIGSLLHIAVATT